MEETGSLEKPIPSGKCYLDLNRARLSSLAAARPETIRSQSEALQRQWLQACLPSAAMPTFS